MYNLFLDDQRKPKDVNWVDLPLVEWVIVRNFEDFVIYIKTHGLPTRVSFDHDLALEHYPFMEEDGGISKPTTIPYDKYREKTGYHCVQWLVERCHEVGKPFPEYYIHTMNPIGAENMKAYIKNYEKILLAEKEAEKTPTPSS